MICTVGILGPGSVATRAVLPAFNQVSQVRLLAVASRDNDRAAQSPSPSMDASRG
jgi:predicted dehydrogenase